MSLHQPQARRGGLRPIADVLTPAIVRFDHAVAAREAKSIIQTLADVGGWEAPEPDTERYRMLDHALSQRGVSWGRGGGVQFEIARHDGWSLAKACAEHATGRDCINVERIGNWGTSEQEARLALTQWGMEEVRYRHAAPGDVLLFKMDEGQFHPGIMSAPGGDLTWAMLPGKRSNGAKMIHAYYGRSVFEAWLGEWWSDRLFGVWSFDGPGSPRDAMKAAA